jgi:hypothetical protein
MKSQQQSCRNRRDLQLLFWLSLHFKQFKFWISKYKNFEQNLRILNDFKWKSRQQQSVELIDIYNFYFSHFSVRLCLDNSQFEFKKYENIKHYFGILNDFKWKLQHQSCIIHWDPQLLFWSFFYPTLFKQFKFWI